MLARVLFPVLGCVAVVALTPAARGGEGPKHPHMHHALFEMAKARVELKEAAHDFGGHREKALKAIDEAIPHMEKALEAAGDKYVAVEPSAEVYKKYESHPHLHHALHEMEEAHTELKEAKHDFGGHRKKALEKVDHAIEELKEAVKYAKK